MDLKRFGPRVVLFSDTSGGGVQGLIRRLRSAGDRSATDLLVAARRKVRRLLLPHRLMPFAQAIHIEITNACNLKCVMCPRPNMDRPAGFMDRNLFTKIIRQLAVQKRHIESVALMGLGEPFLHKEFFDYARLAKQARLRRLYTSTNATLLDESTVKRLFDDNTIDLLILSLDGASKETYESIRPGVPFEVVEANVQCLLAEKKRRGVYRPTVELQILLMEKTAGEIEAFCEKWVGRLGPGDRILVKEADTFGGQVPDFRTAELRNREPAKRFACRQLWKDLSIGWDGQVTVCCKDVFYKLVVGDANREHLVDIWRGLCWSRIRRAHLDQQWSQLDPCDNCREWWI